MDHLCYSCRHWFDDADLVKLDSKAAYVCAACNERRKALKPSRKSKGRHLSAFTKAQVDYFSKIDNQKDD